MQDPDAALPRDGDGETGFGHRVHRRADQGDVQPDISGKARAHVYVSGHHLGFGGHEEDVAEGEAFLKDFIHSVPSFR